MLNFGKKKFKIGIVLGGGGARGFAHLGVMEALAEKNIKPDIISGVSAGAIAGAFLAEGYSPKETFEIIRKYNFTGMSTLNVPKTGLLSLSKMERNLREKIKTDRLENLKTPLVVTVTNMLEGKAEYLTEGPLSKVIQASSSIPVLFSPVELDGKLYADGGIFDNVPVTPLLKNCKKIIAVNISPVQKVDKLNNLIQVATRMFQLAVKPDNEQIAKKSDLYIEPAELCNYDIMDTKNAEKIFDIGYDYTKKLGIQF